MPSPDHSPTRTASPSSRPKGTPMPQPLSQISRSSSRCLYPCVPNHCPLLQTCSSSMSHILQVVPPSSEVIPSASFPHPRVQPLSSAESGTTCTPLESAHLCYHPSSSPLTLPGHLTILSPALPAFIVPDPLMACSRHCSHHLPASPSPAGLSVGLSVPSMDSPNALLNVSANSFSAGLTAGVTSASSR